MGRLFNQKGNYVGSQLSKGYTAGSFFKDRDIKDIRHDVAFLLVELILGVIIRSSGS